MLIVNTSTTTADTVQYRKLEQLYQQYHDSLVIIAVPSDDFGHAPGNDDSIRTFISAHYDIHYILGAKASVKGAGISPLYDWLTDESKNGMLAQPVRTDYYKFLIDKDGTLIGIFNRSVDPMSEKITNAIEQL